jgi:hypothetical protein
VSEIDERVYVSLEDKSNKAKPATHEPWEIQAPPQKKI